MSVPVGEPCISFSLDMFARKCFYFYLLYNYINTFIDFDLD